MAQDKDDGSSTQGPIEYVVGSLFNLGGNIASEAVKATATVAIGIDREISKVPVVGPLLRATYRDGITETIADNNEK